jgi:hypothetical protein
MPLGYCPIVNITRFFANSVSLVHKTMLLSYCYFGFLLERYGMMVLWIHPELPLIGIDENAALVLSNGQARLTRIGGWHCWMCRQESIRIEVDEDADESKPQL